METINAYLPEVIAFHHVAKLGGFTQAAEELNLSKAQLSKQVARLETVLKAQLFHRTTRKISLTQEGKHLLKYAEGIVQLSQQAAEGMKELVNEEGGLIRITAPNSLGDWFAPELLKIFQAKLPNIKVEIDLSNAKRDLVNDGYDFALRAMDETDPNLIARYIGHIRDVIVATPAFIKEHKLKIVEPQDLKKYPALVNSHQQMWNTWKLQKGKQDMIVEIQGNYASTSYTTMKLMALEALGFARLPYYLAEKELRAGSLKALCSDYVIATHPLYLVYSFATYRSKRHSLAKELILSWISSQKNVFIAAY